MTDLNYPGNLVSAEWLHQNLSNDQLLVLDGVSRLLPAPWSPAGRDIITSWSDGSVKVWSGATREDLGKLVGNSDNFESQFDDWRVKSMNHIAD